MLSFSQIPNDSITKSFFAIFPIILCISYFLLLIYFFHFLMSKIPIYICVIPLKYVCYMNHVSYTSNIFQLWKSSYFPSTDSIKNRLCIYQKIPFVPLIFQEPNGIFQSLPSIQLLPSFYKNADSYTASFLFLVSSPFEIIMIHSGSYLILVRQLLCKISLNNALAPIYF